MGFKEEDVVVKEQDVGFKEQDVGFKEEEVGDKITDMCFKMVHGGNVTSPLPLSEGEGVRSIARERGFAGLELTSPLPLSEGEGVCSSIVRERGLGFWLVWLQITRPRRG